MASKLMEWVSGPAAGAAAWWIFSSLVQTMPPPEPMERWYGWFYNFLQRAGANHFNVDPAKPQPPRE
jgi:hypothetical protein